MYEGVAEQLHKFIVASSTASSLPSVAVLPFTSFPNNTTFHHNHHHDPTILTNYPSSSPLFSILSSSLSSAQPQQQIRREVDEDNTMMDNKNGSNWSNDEVLALLKIRSSLENWFHDFTNWDQVSRKMAEQGFKRSAEKCKEKYEEESRFFNLNTATHNNNKSDCMFSSELEDQLFHSGNDDHIIENEQVNGATDNDNVQNPIKEVLVGEMQHREQVVVVREAETKTQQSKKKYRKRKFEMMKCFCESVVRSTMAQQEELYNKILEDMVKRDNENIAREEAWQKQEIDRFNKEVEIRAKEQSLAYDRQASMNEFFKTFGISQDSHFPSSIDPTFTSLSQNPNNKPGSSALVAADKNPASCTNHTDANHLPNSPNLKLLNPQNDPSRETPASSSPPCQMNQNPNIGSSNDQEADKDYSKRWPRDEVLALINLRSNFYTTNEEKEGSISNNNNNKGPLWEKISQGMIELGYKRNAKRCKEKWENINKYFRKTKDTNASKKRSLNSRTCPYFHQLSNLYKQGSTSTTTTP